jgi:eukaryotic-like serine/threonine-protein kinase
MGAVYRAVDRLNGNVVALKRVTVATDQLQFNTRISMTDSRDFRMALAQEFKMLATLRHPNIISVLDYGFDDQRQPYFTMDFLRNAQPLVSYGRDASQETRVDLIIQTLQALAYLHRRGIIHRDVKPGNVVVVEGQVKVLDFGLAITREFLDTSNDDGLNGTLAYMAPEVIQGAPPDESSDLYAVGLMAYDLLAGSFPFETESFPKLVQQILNVYIDTSPIENTSLAEVISTLVTKDRDFRYSDAHLVIDDLRTALDQTTVENPEIRESYLQAARFVGRDAEYKQLTTAFKQASIGAGTGWLIGGESGVGKSRLLEEMRTHALVEGAQVVRGQTTAERAEAYGVWREVLRYLALYIQLTPLEASVLKAIVPEISTFVGYDVPDAPEVDPQTSRNRLFDVIERVFLRQAQPLVVMFEDLQWADSESLAVIQRISPGIGRVPVMLIGSYRDDERPDLPTLLPAMQVLKLERFSTNAISALSQAILGNDVGRRSSLIELLERETEGNVFFIVEVLRALAQEAGQLNLLKEAALPATVFAQGITTIIQRRLDRVPTEAKNLLQLAAVLGRFPDIQVLQAADPDRDLDSWLTLVSDTAVLDVQDNRWRFAHDKLREGILAGLSVEETRQLHRQAATLTEHFYASSPEHYGILAHHWAEAGVPEKEYHYSILASERAMDNKAFPTAITYLERVLALQPSIPKEVAKSEAYVRQKLGDAHLSLGQMSLGRTQLEHSLTLRGYHIGKNQFQLGLGILRAVARQTLHRLLPGQFVKQRQTINQDLLEAADIYDRLADIYFFGNDVFRTLEAQTRALNLAEQAGGISKELARSYSSMSTIAGSVRLSGVAEKYIQLSNKTSEQLNHIPTEAYIWMAYSLYYVGGGQWQRLTEATERSLKICNEIGDSRVWGMNMIVVSAGAQFQSQFKRARDLFAELREGGTRINDPTQTIVGMTGQANNSFHLDDLNQCWKIIYEAFDQPEDLAGNVHAKIQLYALQGLLQLRMGDNEKALELAKTADDILAGELPTNPFSMLYFNYLAEIYLTLMEMGYRTEEMAKNAARILRGYSLFAGNFAIGRAGANRWKGVLAWQQGNPTAARKYWDTGLAEAQKVQMPYEAALIHYEIGRHLEKGSPERKQHLEQARDLFTQLETPFDLNRVEEVMD